MSAVWAHCVAQLAVAPVGGGGVAVGGANTREGSTVRRKVPRTTAPGHARNPRMRTF